MDRRLSKLAPARALVAAALAGAVLGGGAGLSEVARAQSAGSAAEPDKRYCAYIGRADLRDSRGLALKTAAEVLRQDRINFHRNGLVQDGDTPDVWFHDLRARDAMARMKIRFEPPIELENRILDGGVRLHVRVLVDAGVVAGLEVAIAGRGACEKVSK